MNHSSTRRKISWVPQRQQCGYECVIALGGHDQTLALEVGDHVAREILRRVLDGAGDPPGLPAEAVDEDPELVDRIDHRQVEGLGEREVLLPAAGGDMDDTGALRVVDLGPRDDAVGHAGSRRKLVERPGVGQVHQLGALRFADDGGVPRHPGLRARAHPPATPVTALDELVREVRVHRRGDVARQRPRRRRPDEQVLVLVAGGRHRQAQGERQVGDVLVALGRLHVADARAAARAPCHDVVAAVQEPAPLALGQESPDRVVVLVAVRVVAVLPVHPHPEPFALLGDECRESLDALEAQLDEPIDPERLDLALVVEAELLLDLDLDPEPLAVEPVLVALPFSEHRVVALVEVLVRAAPGVVDAHRVVGRDRSVQEAVVAVGVRVARQVAGHRVALAPALDDLALQLGHVQLAVDRPEHVVHGSRYEKTRPENPGREGESRGTTRA